jgi:hypothetical protein
MTSEGRDRSYRLALIAALVFYAAVATWAAFRSPELINPDAVSYIRLAEYLVAGRAGDSVSSYWSPMISWCIAPLLAAGVDGLVAARIVLGIWGAVFVAVSFVFIRRFSSMPATWTFLALAGISVMTVQWTASAITPDVIVASFLMLYFALVLRDDLLTSRRLQLLCGLIGGAAYLAKTYALPFFLVHFPSALILRCIQARRQARDAGQDPPRWARLAPAWATGMAGLVVLVGPWVAVISAKAGGLTISSSARINHAIVAPGNPDRKHPTEHGLWPAPPGRISVWEVPETLPYQDWSPFAGPRLFRHQLKILAENARLMRQMLCRYDAFALTLVVLGACPVLLYVLRRRVEDLFRLLWFLGTAVLYCSGYLLVAVEDRYVMPVLWPLACACCFHLGWLLRERIHRDEPDNRRDWAGILILLVLSVSLVGGAVREVRQALRNIEDAPCRGIAQRLSASGLTGPIAGTSRHLGLYIAYHMNQPFMYRPASEAPTDARAELDRAGARMLIVWPDSPLYGSFAGGSWVLADMILNADKDGPVEVYVRADR